MPKYKTKPGKLWKFPEIFDHERHIAFLRARSQAASRRERWDITLEDYFQIWHSQADWERRGRTRQSLQMRRRDPDLPWSTDNVEIVERDLIMRDNVEKRLGR